MKTTVQEQKLLDRSLHYYEKHAIDYFWKTFHQDLGRMWSKFLQNLSCNAKIIDLGSGSGRDVAHFARRGFNSIGIDASFNLTSIASRITRQPFVIGDIRSLPFREDSFDAAWSLGSLLHMERVQVAPVLQQLCRILRSEALFFTALKKGSGEFTDYSGRVNVLYTSDEWASLLADANFEILDLEEVVELREASNGHKEEITWIESIAIARRSSLFAFNSMPLAHECIFIPRCSASPTDTFTPMPSDKRVSVGMHDGKHVTL